ncbi:MAG: hypothetical protein JWL84_4145 [Rhodospirillales bacterium]|jgi:hypothetical protein|nr:hypothetical protein [Rhodospirillales bacterium]
MTVAAKSLVGTWKLISISRRDVATGVETDTWGPGTEGYITYGAEGRMMTLIVRGGRTGPQGKAAGHDEGAALFASMMSYGGTYRLEGERVVHTIDIAWNEAWKGTTQERFLVLDGNRVRLSTPPSPDPLDGVMSVRTITWEKLA